MKGLTKKLGRIVLISVIIFSIGIMSFHTLADVW